MDRRCLIGLLLSLAITGVSPLLQAQSADAVVAEVETRLRRPLSTGERRIVGDAARAWSADLRTLARRFSQDLAATTGLQAGQVAALVADIADPMAVRTLGPEIETLRDRPLTARQRGLICCADASRPARSLLHCPDDLRCLRRQARRNRSSMPLPKGCKTPAHAKD
jgi:hypothetical protein